jgi:GT2 family glycosyltransferase
MDIPSFRDHHESETELEELKERLKQVEEELRLQDDAHRRTARLIEALSSSVEQQRLGQNRLQEDVTLLSMALQTVEGRTQEILRSRIWRTFVSVGGLMLRRPWILSGGVRPSLPPRPVEAREARARRLVQVPIQRAWSSRHAQGAMTIANWEEAIRSVSSSRPRAEASTPRISIITPTWNTKPSWFAEAALSVLEQSCADWEWCIADDASTTTDFFALFPVLEETGKVRIRRLERHAGISEASNEGLRLASAAYVCFLDHDDLLAPTALAECLEMLEQGLDAVYTDSDKVDEAGLRREPFHKPDWSPEYFRGVMYVGHLLCVRRDLALEAGGFDSHYDRIQDFEFMLRFSERTQRIGHVSRVLYHWRAVPGSVAATADAKGDIGGLQKEAVQAHLRRLHLPATAEPGSVPHRIRVIPLPRNAHPTVSIIIPTKDAPDVLEKCLCSIIQRTAYPGFEIVCVDNETRDPRALHLLRTSPIKRVLFPGRFNFSQANNCGVKQASGEYLVFMNNDIEVITADWIQEMLYYAEQNDVGAVGGLLLYPDRTVQHAGIVLGCRGTADHVLRHAPAGSDGYAGSLTCAHEVSAVTAACMMLRRETFDQIGGFNGHYFTAYQDVDLCLQLRSLGKRNIFCPQAVFFHFESYSRGSHYDFVDRNLLLDRWEEMMVSDPYYNPNFDADTCDYALKVVEP